MTMRRMLPVFLVTVFALATDPAQAEMKSQWVEYAHGDTKLKAYMVYDDKVTGRRPAVLMIHAREGQEYQHWRGRLGWHRAAVRRHAGGLF